MDTKDKRQGRPCRINNSSVTARVQMVMQNASASVTEDEYRHRYNDLTERFHTEEEKHKRLTEKRKRMVAESIAIGGMLSQLTELEAPPIEFDEKL